MPRPNRFIDEAKQYLRKKFMMREDFKSECYRATFPYEMVKEALYLIKRVDPSVYSDSWYFWGTTRSRNSIADGLLKDSSTVKRRFDTFIIYLLNILVHPDLIPIVPLIDLRAQMDEEITKGGGLPQFNEDGSVYTAADYFLSKGITIPSINAPHVSTVKGKFDTFIVHILNILCSPDLIPAIPLIDIQVSDKLGEKVEL